MVLLGYIRTIRGQKRNGILEGRVVHVMGTITVCSVRNIVIDPLIYPIHYWSPEMNGAHPIHSVPCILRSTESLRVGYYKPDTSKLLRSFPPSAGERY